MNRTKKRQMCKSPTGITSAKKKDLLMLWKKGLIPKQHQAFFNSPTVTISGGKKNDAHSNSDSNSEEDESSDTHHS